MKRLLAILLCLPQLSWATITRVNTLHQYTASSGTPYSLGTVTAGNAIVCGVSTGGPVAAVTLSDSVNGSAYTHLSQLAFDSGVGTIDIFYLLSAGAGATSITPTTTAGDIGLSCEEIHTSAGTWSFDNSISVDGSLQAATASPRTGNFTTTGNDDYWFMYFADEQESWTGSCATVPCPTGSFTNIQWDNTHIDAQAEWLDATQQTNLSSGWTATSAAVTHWAIYLSAFKATSTVTITPGLPRGLSSNGGRIVVNGAKVVVQ